jgi:hypothetical protein
MDLRVPPMVQMSWLLMKSKFLFKGHVWGEKSKPLAEGTDVGLDFCYGTSKIGTEARKNKR